MLITSIAIPLLFALSCTAAPTVSEFEVPATIAATHYRRIVEAETKDEPWLDASSTIDVSIEQHSSKDKRHHKDDEEYNCEDDCRDCCKAAKKKQKIKKKKPKKPKRPVAEGSVLDAMKEEGVNPWVRFALPQDGDYPRYVPGEDGKVWDPYSVDVPDCGERPVWNDKPLGWHAEYEAMEGNKGARIKCHTFTLVYLESDAQDTAQDDTQDWFAIFTFDTNSTLAWSSNIETHIPNLKNTGTIPLAELDTSFHYAFQCSEYDDYEVEGDVQWRGKWCSIISRQNSEAEKCLQADVIPGNWRGALSAVPCDRKNNLQLWHLIDATADFEVEGMADVRIDTPMENVPDVLTLYEFN